MKNFLKFLMLLFVVCFTSLGVFANLAVTDDEMTFYTHTQKDDAALFAESKGLTPLSTPANLKWNINEHGEKVNGCISWDAVENCEGEYEITLYCDGEPVYNTKWGDLYDNDGNGRIGVEIFADDQFSKSGTYHVSIVAVGDQINYDDSKEAKSTDYKFNCPTAKLETPTQLEWTEFGFLRHKAVANAWGYLYEVFDQNHVTVGCMWGPVFEDDDYIIEDLTWYFEDISGWYDDLTTLYVAVKAITTDIEIFRNSDYSAYSPAVDIEKNTTSGKHELNNVLNMIYSGNISASDAVDEFKNALENNDITNSALAVSMQQDEELVDSIAILENEFMNETCVETDIVDNSGSYLYEKGIDVSDIQMVGAALNSEDGNDVSLIFDTPDPTISLDPLFYKNAVGVGIDMEGVSDNQNLEIPIQIKMPIPSNVLPERLVIVHCHRDGSQEIIHPAVETIGEKYYAKFVLTSFSTFVFCNKDFDVGDINKDEAVDMNDAILLLQYSMFPELYPLDYEGDVDFTDDGEIDMNDAILLLQYSMFPELYPIE